MDFQEWEPIYERILLDFEFSRERDELAMRVLSALTERSDICDDTCLKKIIGDEVTVIGGAAGKGPLDPTAIIGTVLSCGSGTGRLLKAGMIPDLIVTDLDGDVSSEISAISMGAVAVVHAHGDNIAALERIVPELSGRLVPTGQSRPWGNVRDFGGFTDGDRAVLMAVHFGARRIRLVGFDFETPSIKPGSDPGIKRRKLVWARRIIYEHLPKDIIVEMI